MADFIRSPDEVLLYFAAKAMRLAYKGFGVSPLAVQFWPTLWMSSVSCLGFLVISFDVHPCYLVLAILCSLWPIRVWMNLPELRGDAKKEWSNDLFRKYGGKAAVLRANTTEVRHLTLMGALVTTLISCSDMSDELIMMLSSWQRCVVPMTPWAVAILAYTMSAELPEPGDGDRFSIARPV
jgi:hypothetical protein